MLHFHGIEPHSDGLKRFSFNLNLLQSLSAVAKLLAECGNDFSLLQANISAKIEQLFAERSHLASLSPKIKHNLRKLYLQRDIALFLAAHKPHAALLQAVISRLNSGKNIAASWEYISRTIITDSKLSKDFLENEDVVFDQASFIGELLQFIQLCFLDQVAEYPPANLKLVLIPKQFPQHNWISYEAAEHKRLLAWSSANKHGSLSYLQIDLWRRFKNHQTALPQAADFQPRLASSQPESLFKISGIDFLIPELTKDKAQASLLPERPWESLRAFQAYVRQKYSLKGGQVLCAIFRQLLPRSYGKQEFDLKRHFDLLSDNAKQRPGSKKKLALWQQTVALLQDLEKIEIIRTHEKREQRSRLVLICETEYDNQASNYPCRFSLLLDKIFYNYDAASGILPLSLPYLAIPERFFKLKIPRSYGDLVNVLVYLTTKWSLEYKINQGRLTTSVQEIIEGANLAVSQSAKYRIVYKVLAMIRFMKEQQLINDYYQTSPASKHPWQASYSIRASQDSIKSLANFYQLTPALAPQSPHLESF